MTNWDKTGGNIIGDCHEMRKMKKTSKEPVEPATEQLDRAGGISKQESITKRGVFAHCPREEKWAIRGGENKENERAKFRSI